MQNENVLHFHKNTKGKREARELAESVKGAVQEMRSRMGDEFQGAALVAFNKDGTMHMARYWAGRSSVPPACIPELAKQGLRRAVDSNVE